MTNEVQIAKMHIPLYTQFSTTPNFTNAPNSVLPIGSSLLLLLLRPRQQQRYFSTHRVQPIQIASVTHL